MPEKPRDATLRQQIDENLRRVYQEKVEEAIPAHLMDLLSRLRAQDTQPVAQADDESAQ